MKPNGANDTPSSAPSDTTMNFVHRIIKRNSRPPICEGGNHEWMLISGQGYDYNSDYYLCKKCERRIFRYDFENNKK